MASDITSFINLILNLALGGGFIITFITLRSTRIKAAAEAKSAMALAESIEIDNVSKAIAIWRDMAENVNLELQASRAQYQELTKHVSVLRSDIARISAISTRILKMLDDPDHSNLEKMISAIREEINKNNS